MTGLCSLSEPAIQRAARQLEKLAEAPLFERTLRGVRLTSAGLTLAADAGVALREIELAHAELREMSGRYDGPLVVGTLPLVRTSIVPRAVVALNRRYPEARIRLTDGDYDALIGLMRNGHCDMVLGALRGADCPAGLEERVLFRDHMVIAARAGHPLAGRSVSAAELAQYPWVLPRPNTPGRAVFDRMMAETGIADPSRGEVETGSLVALRGILLESDFLTILSPRQLELELRQGLICPIDYPVEGSGRDIGITVLSGWYPTALQRRFIDEVTLACGADPA